MNRALFLSAVVAVIGVPAGVATAETTPVVNLFTAPASVTFGERTEIAGRVRPAVTGTTVAVQRQAADGTWVTLTRLTAGEGGRFTASLALRQGGHLRTTTVATDGTSPPGIEQDVVVRPVTKLTVTAALYEAIAGRPLRFDALVAPGVRGQRVTVEGGNDGRAYHPVATLVIGADGHARGSVPVPVGGLWRFRVAAVPVAGRQVANETAPVSLKIYSQNPHGVPASEPTHIVQVLHETQIYVYFNGKLNRVLPVVFGKPSTPSPVGQFRVYSKTTGPSSAFGPLVLWYHRGYGIHGTNQEYLLDDPVRFYSHGCTRNYNDNIRWLWPKIPVGTPVTNLA